MKQINFAPPKHHRSSANAARWLSLTILGSIVWIICLSGLDLLLFPLSSGKSTQSTLNTAAHQAYLRESKLVAQLRHVDQLLEHREPTCALHHIAPILDQYKIRLNRFSWHTDQAELVVIMHDLDAINSMVRHLATINLLQTIAVHHIRQHGLDGAYELVLSTRKKTTDSIKKS